MQLNVLVPKSSSVEKVNSKVFECSERVIPVFSFIQTYVPTISGFVLVILQKSMVDPPRPTFEGEAITSTSGGTLIIL